MKKDGFWEADVERWVGNFPKKKSLNFGRWMGLEHRNREILVNGRVLTTKFWQVDGFEKKTGILMGSFSRWMGIEQEILVDRWV